MKVIKNFILAFAIIGGFTSMSAAEKDTASSGTPFRFETGGFLALDEGQIVKGESILDATGTQGPYEHRWQQRLFMQLSSKAQISERLRVILSAECALSFSLRRYSTVPSTLQPLFNWYPNAAQGSYGFGNPDQPVAVFTFGYFTYKYNPDARNLGEYMFRTGTYPQWIVSDFEFPMARLLGFKLSSYVFHDRFKNDLLLTSEMNTWPLQDFSLSYIGSYRMHDFCEVGAGITLNHWFSAFENYTTPKVIPQNRLFLENGDTAFYTFRGIKLIGRSSLDFKRFIPSSVKGLLGKNDLTAYGEAAVLGVKNYSNHIMVGDTVKDPITGVPIKNPLTGMDSVVNSRWVKDPNSFYDNVRSRIPVMFGCNLPTPSLFLYPLSFFNNRLYSVVRRITEFDVVSLEFEYFPAKYLGSSLIAEDIAHQNLPLPDPGTTGTSQNTWSTWKWSLYAQKNLGGNLALVGLVARDHMRSNINAPSAYQDKQDFLFKKDHFWWMLRLKVSL